MFLNYILKMKESKLDIYLARVKLNMMRNDLIHNLLHPHHMQRDTLHAKLKDIYMNNRERLDVAMAADQICTAITNDEKVKGLYLYGPFGTGKSFILGAIANQLKSQKISSTIVYLPEFIRTLKGGFKDGSFEKNYNVCEKLIF